MRLRVGQAEVDAGDATALPRENRRLREDVDILKQATSFFAKEAR
ncbi:hypothetical protein ACFWRZ_00495 [Streptomyces rubiginosohelvolus]